MKKDSNVIVRIDSSLKNNVMNIVEENGYTISDLVTACLCDIERRKSIPIFLKRYLPRPKLVEENKVTIAYIKQCVEQMIVKYGRDKVKKAYLFGSFSRGEEKNSSDVDLRFEIERGFSMYDLSNIHNGLKEKFRREVDIVTQSPERLDAKFYQTIRKDEICIYEHER